MRQLLARRFRAPFVAWLLIAAAPLTLALPSEVEAVRFSDPSHLAWDPAPGAVSYNVYRGTLADGSDLRCLTFRTAATTALDPVVPGSLATYLVAGFDGADEGTLGTGTGGTPRIPLVPCRDADGDAVRDDQDNCAGLSNPTQDDQDGDAVGDFCDPGTYHFELDPLGARPAAMTQDGGANSSFVVQDYAGDRGVAYGAAGNAVIDRFDRLTTLATRPGFDLYLDTVATPSGFAIVEFWSDGNPGERAGRSLRLLVGQGVVGLQSRRGDLVVSLGEQPVDALERLRVRVRGAVGGARSVSVDSWNGSGWNEAAATFAIASDEPYFGREIGLSESGGGTRAVTRLTIKPVFTGPEFAIERRFDRLTDWQLVQRGAGGTAPLALSLSYRSSAAVRAEIAVEASTTGLPLPGFDYADHQVELAAAPSGAIVTVTVPDVPQGGNYDVRVRWVAPQGGAILGSDLLTQVAIGDLYLAAGQSNMSGYSGSLDPAETPIATVHLFGNDYRWKRAREPMDDGTDQVDRVGEEAPAHSLMLRFAKDLSAGLGVPVGIIPAPLGGTNLYAQWQRTAGDPAHRGTLYGSSIHRVLCQQAPHPIRGAIWYQGESDAGRGTDAYLADLRALLANWRSDLVAPLLYFGNCQLANYQQADFETWLPIQEAQRRFALEEPRSAVIALVDQPRADAIHLNVDGYKTAGARLARAVLAGDHGVPQWLGPQLQAVRFQAGSNRTRIEVVYDKPVQGGLAQVFRAYDGAVQVTITGYSISGSTITLQLIRAISAANSALSYGTSRAAGGPTWVTATDGSGATLAFYRIKVQ